MNEDLRNSIEKSVLCWLATSTPDGLPNVSPKEVFTHFGNQIIVANIASPNTVKNIRMNPRVCISFIDIFVQKGFQAKGNAEIADSSSPNYSEMEAELLKITQGKFPFSMIISISVDHVKPIIAPKYHLYPDTTEQQQIASAMETYGVRAR